MTSLFIASAITDFLPSIQDPPKSFSNFCSSIYSSSKLSIPLSPTHELSRVHLCVFVAIKHYQDQYNWPDPIQSKIPLPKSKVTTLINQFSTLLSPSTPTHTRIYNPLQTPTTGSARSNKTPRAKPQLVTQTSSSVKRSLTDQLIAESSLSGSTNVPDSFLNTPQTSPVKRRRGRPPKNGYKDSDSIISDSNTNISSPVSTSTSVLSTPRKYKQLLTSPELIAFCNKFYIPEHLTKRILNMYQKFRSTVSSGWGLLVGLVGVVYYRLNITQILSQLGLWSKVLFNLHRAQNGGLSYKQVEGWIQKVTTLYGDTKWIREAEYEGGLSFKSLNKQSDHEVFASLGSFNNRLDYLSGKATENWKLWCVEMSKHIEM